MNFKRTIITAVVALAVVAVVAPSVAQGVTVDELLAQIAQLQAQLTALSGTSTAGTGLCAGVTFTRNLTVGSTGSDVKCLQSILSVTPTSGYFGPLTLAAVKQYQASKGFTPANQVGPMTRAALNAQLAVTTTPTTPTTPTTSTPGVEGSIIVTASPSPASGTDVYTGTTGVAISAVDVKATGSDVVVNRATLNFNLRPWLYISNLTVSDGTTSKSIAVTQANSSEITIGNNYTVRIEGVNIVVPKDTTKKLTFTVDAVSALPAGTTSQAVIATVDTNAIRGTDGAGLSQYGPSAALSATRTFTVKAADTGTLEVSASTDNPKDQNVIVSETATTDVTMMKFNVTAKSNDVILRTIRIAATASDTLATVMPTVRLFDGTTELASTSTAASSAFGDLSLRIPKGTTKTLTVVGTIAKQVAGTTYAEGSNASTTLANTAVVGEDATTYAQVTSTNGASITGGTTYFYLKAPTFALVSQSVTPVTTTDGTTTAVNATLKFNVTANGGDIWIRDYSSDVATSGVVATSTAVNASGTIVADVTTNAYDGTNGYKVSAGDTKYFEVSAVITNGEAGGFFVGLKPENVKWATTDSSTAGDYQTQTWGLENIETGKVYITAGLAS